LNVLTQECQWNLLVCYKKKDIMVGAIDVATNKIETPRQVANILKQALKYTSIKHLIGCTNCGMVTMPREIANAKLKALADGAALLSREL